MSAADGIRQLAERQAELAVPLWHQPDWSERFPWLVQGTTGAHSTGEPYDLGLWGAQPVGATLRRWSALQQAVGMPTAVHARQVHGAELRVHRRPATPGLLLSAGFDGHLTADAGLLLTVSVADCVPIFLVDADRRVLGLLHGGWRGVAAGIVEHAVAALRSEYGSSPGSLWLHCGPSICGTCYEVGPEVHRALRPGTAGPDRPLPVDLRRVVVERALASGISAARCSLSTHCTRCTAAAPGSTDGARPFFSHRAGDAGRQMGLLGRSE